MKAKILFVMPSLGSGGAEKSFVSMLPLLSRDKFDIHVMVVKEGGLFYPLLPGNGITYINAPKNFKIALGSMHSRYMKEECTLWDRMRKLISNMIVRLHSIMGLGLLQLTWEIWKAKIPTQQERYDVAVSFMDGMTNFYVIDKVNAKKKILWVHNDYNKIKTNIKYEHPFFAKADNVVTISDICVKSLKENFTDIAEKFICLENISSGQMINTMADDFSPQEYKDLNDTVKILSIGRLSPQKGFDMAIDAAAILKNQGFKFKWHIIGVGALRDSLQRQIASCGLQEDVLLLGERKNPYPYIKHCDMVLQTSRYEGKSIVLDEAKILHKPIIATRYPSVSDNIEDGQSGIVCDINAASIADAIIKLSDDRRKQHDLIAYLNENCNGNEHEIEKYDQLFEA